MNRLLGILIIVFAIWYGKNALSAKSGMNRANKIKDTFIALFLTILGILLLAGLTSIQEIMS